MEPEHTEYPAWTMEGEENTVVIEHLDGDPVRYRIVAERPGKTKVLQPWTDIAELNIIPQDRTTSDLADLIIDRHDLIGEGRHKADSYAQRVGELVGKGLSANEANIYAKVEAHQKTADIANELGISQQALSEALRQARIKMAGKE